MSGFFQIFRIYFKAVHLFFYLLRQILGCVGDFLYRRVLGLQNAGTGYDRILISPEYSCPLNRAEGSLHSVNGMIRLKWEKDEKEILFSGQIPANTCAEIKLPDGTIREIGNGRFEIRAEL